MGTKVREHMRTEVVTLRIEDALDVADDVMTLGRIRHMPVVDADGHVAGVVTQRDLLRASMSSALRLGASQRHEWLGKVPVSEVIVTPAVTIGPDELLATAVERMLEHKIGCLPVVERGRLIGLLTESDLLRHLADLLQPRH